jgi:hypothetical protein
MMLLKILGLEALHWGANWKLGSPQDLPAHGHQWEKWLGTRLHNLSNR